MKLNYKNILYIFDDLPMISFGVMILYSWLDLFWFFECDSEFYCF
jgi:hypothetical protein